jgi:dTDP-4-dehydrorhamnose reductase
MDRILLLGGSGLLGRELQKHLKYDAPSHRELDIVKPVRIKKKYDLIINSSGYTDVVKAEKEQRKCYAVNVVGTMNLLHRFPDTPFVYISSEYAKNPVNYYSFTKYMGESIVKYYSGKYLIIRTLFKPNPFPWKKAFIDQYTQGDYVDTIAPLIVKEIKRWNKKTCKTIYVGTGRKIMYELARRSRLDVGKSSIKDIKGVKLPADYL